MEMSEKVDKIFPAFAKMQSQLSNASKNVDKAGITWKYADLAECINTARPHLEANELGVTQLLGDSNSGVALTTMMVHSSGQWFKSSFTMANAVLHGSSGKNPAQCMGSSVTYMRRYAYAAITGMAQADDDGTSLTPNSSKPKPTPKAISNPDIDLIVDAINRNDIQFARENWQGIIGKYWGDLNDAQTSKLNEMIKG